MGNLSRWQQVGGGNFFKWDEPGKKLEGIWRGTKPGKFGDLGLIDTESGGRIAFPIHTALIEPLKQVKEGVEVLIHYMGPQTSKGGREFKAFQVFVTSQDAIADEPSDDVPF